MAPKRKNKSKRRVVDAHSSAVGGDEFSNAPFSGLGRDLRKVRKQARDEVAVPDVAQPEEFCEPPRPEIAPSDDELFKAAASGARSLDGPSRFVAESPPVDVARMRAAREAQLASLGKAEGLELSYSEGFIRARAPGVNKEMMRRLERGEFSARSHLDLHGMILEDALPAVDDFIRTRHARGERCVLLVVGKGRHSPGGRGILRESVPEWLACGPSSRLIVAFVTARDCDGGIGALYVLLRGKGSHKSHISVEVGGGGKD